ncbi:hypothetical protein GCM10011348_14090 [Marinobacterium nitratireducens]|uniref:Sulfotransferase domain-containing protein n=1 Tax=Marinobacterium nitratireducens TaxID=518897 RepID=A0A918DQJ7_9GAMM|nr:hypothetical protein [Marinobacterium nitratireducens]GGO79543.1 hypothetical protein GCM10011348_14090 [Marinobacterium nitratireducens]
MSIRKKIFLHIGSHKTGTTSIQRFLSLNTEALSDQGFFYLIPNPWPLVIKTNGVDFAHNIKTEGFDIIDDLGHDNIIISHENYSWLSDLRNISLLKKSLSRFGRDIKIVLYLRRQDSLAVSQKQEGTKWIDCSLAYGHDISALPSELSSRAERYLDFYDKVRLWADVFGEENVILRAFEKGQLKNEDVVDDFCGLVGIEKNNSFRDVGRVNESISRRKQIILHASRQFVGERNKVKDFMVRYIVNHSADDDEKLLPSRAAAIEFYEKFKEKNRLLNDEYNITNNKFLFDEDFSKYPTIENNNIELDYIVKTFTDMVGSLVNENFDLRSVVDKDLAHILRDIALECESEGDLSSAYRIMSKASSIKPSGHFIKKKLAYYKLKLVQEDGN